MTTQKIIQKYCCSSKFYTIKFIGYVAHAKIYLYFKTNNNIMLVYSKKLCKTRNTQFLLLNLNIFFLAKIRIYTVSKITFVLQASEFMNFNLCKIFSLFFYYLLFFSNKKDISLTTITNMNVSFFFNL